MSLISDTNQNIEISNLRILCPLISTSLIISISGIELKNKKENYYK